VASTNLAKSLLNYQCDMALAGGVSIRVPQKQAICIKKEFCLPMVTATRLMPRHRNDYR